jgi:hypothetical protein
LSIIRLAIDLRRARAEQLVRDFEPQGLVSVFSTQEQTRTSDDYFLETVDKIRFFFEEDAFLPDGMLRQDKARSINKIGHALHDPYRFPKRVLRLTIITEPGAVATGQTPNMRDEARVVTINGWRYSNACCLLDPRSWMAGPRRYRSGFCT